MPTLTIEVSDELYDKIHTDARSVRILSDEEIAVAMIERGYEWRKLRRQHDGATGVDMPDSIGFWAWEDGHNRGVSEIYEGFSKELIVDEEPGGLMPDYFSGRKWHKLTMPWERVEPAAAPVPTPEWEPMHPDDADLLRRNIPAIASLYNQGYEIARRIQQQRQGSEGSG